MKRTLTLLAMILSLGLSPWAQEEIQPLEIGDDLVPFELPGVDGKTYTERDFADAQVLVMVFTCNHCPTAQAYEERIKEMAEEYQDQGVALVAISPNDPKAVRLDELGYTDLNDSFEEMKIRARDHEFNFPYLYAGDHPKWCKQIGPVATPHVFIFDQDRTLRYKGRIDNSEHLEQVTQHDTRNAIEALLAGEPVPVKTTKTFGCSIKYPDKRQSVKDAFARWAQEEVSLSPIAAGDIEDTVLGEGDTLRLINVWATYCGPCVTEFPDLVEINRMYRHRDFELITISADEMDQQEKALRFLQEQEASSTNYIFEEENKYQLIEAVNPDWMGALPYTMLVKKDGSIAYTHMGPIDPLAVKREIVKILGRTY